MNVHKCGGTLINRDTVLTAAHCIANKMEHTFNGTTYYFDIVPNDIYPSIASMYQVYIGAHNISRDSLELNYKTIFNVSKVIKVSYL